MNFNAGVLYDSEPPRLPPQALKQEQQNMNVSLLRMRAPERTNHLRKCGSSLQCLELEPRTDMSTSREGDGVSRIRGPFFYDRDLGYTLSVAVTVSYSSTKFAILFASYINT